MWLVATKPKISNVLCWHLRQLNGWKQPVNCLESACCCAQKLAHSPNFTHPQKQHMEATNIWQLLAGLGIFLYGIAQLEDAIKLLAGRAFKNIIRRYTSTTFRAIGTGTLATAILQSSSAVTLITLAFVGAGIMQLQHAIGVIMGANLGTTATSWIVASLGFKISIEALAMPFVAAGGLLMVFLQERPRTALVGQLLFGFGLLFLGLDFMKESISAAANAFDLRPYAAYNRFFFFGIGVVLTAVVQSSSAAMAIVLTAVFSNIITFNAAAAMAIGANVGTTVTVLISTIGGSTAKKQVGWSHVIFNFTLGLLALLFLTPLVNFIGTTLKLQHDPPMALAAFHTLFNFLGVLVFYPFTGLMARLLIKWVPDKDIRVSKYLKELPAVMVPEAALTSMEKEVDRTYHMMLLHNLAQFDIPAKGVLNKNIQPKKYPAPEKLYPTMKTVQVEILQLHARLTTEPLHHEEAQLALRLRDSAKYAVAAAKTFKDVSRDTALIQGLELAWIQDLYNTIVAQLTTTYRGMELLGEGEDQKTTVSGIHDLLKDLMEYDRLFTTQLATALAQQPVANEAVGALVNLHRALILGGRQSLLAFAELRLPQNQSEILLSLNPIH